MVNARIVQHNGSPAMEVNGRIIPPMAFTPHAFTRDGEYLKALGDAGIEVFFLICDTDWLKPGAVDLLLEDTRVLVEAVPGARILLRVGVHPPVAWLEEHPDDTMRYQDGTTIPCDVITESYRGRYPGMYALYSPAWRRDAGEALIRFIESLGQTAYADHYIGVFFAGGNTSEWYPSNKLTVHAGESAGYYADAVVLEERDRWGDFSPAFRQAFSGYLRRRYGDEDALRRAWNDPAATFDNPPIPGLKERAFTNLDDAVTAALAQGEGALAGDDTHTGMFLNADKYQCAADFYRAFHLGTAHSIIHLGRAVKERFPHLLTGSFYGYFGSLDYFNMGMCAGSLDVLDSGVVDILACPNNYMERQPGGYACQRVMQDSFRLRGRMFFSEDDTRTHRDGTFYRDTMHVYDARDAAEAMKRDFGRDICQDIYGWWFDQVEEGRYKDDTLYALIRRQQQVARCAYAGSRVKHNDIAVFYDEESVHYLTHDMSFKINELYRAMELPRIGAPADYYYHNDLARDDLPEYKLYIFINCFVLDDREREAIHRKVRRAGRTALFLYGQGFINPDGAPRMGAEHVSELTGIRLLSDKNPALTKFRVDAGHPALKGVDSRRVYGYIDRAPQPGTAINFRVRQPFAYPLLYSDDPGAQVLGRFGATGLPALTMKDLGGATSVFCGSIWMQAELVRALARHARCHIYGEDGDFLFANERFVTLHARQAGEKTLAFKSPCSPYEVYERRHYGRDVTCIRFPMALGETRMFLLDGEC